MKPTAPSLSVPDDAPESSLQSEVARACETNNDARITIPAPPSPETLKAATPCPPAPEEGEEEGRRDTTPAPPPSSIRRREGEDDELVPSTIPGAPRLPKIHSM